MDRQGSPKTTPTKTFKSATNLRKLANTFIPWRPKRLSDEKRSLSSSASTTKPSSQPQSQDVAPRSVKKDQSSITAASFSDYRPQSPPNTRRSSNKSWDQASLTSDIFKDTAYLPTQQFTGEYTESQLSLSRQTMFDGVVYYEDRGSMGIDYGRERVKANG